MLEFYNTVCVCVCVCVCRRGSVCLDAGADRIPFALSYFFQIQEVTVAKMILLVLLFTVNQTM